MTRDKILWVLAALMVLTAVLYRPWAKRSFPEREEGLAFVKRVGDALQRFNKDTGFYPAEDASDSLGYYLLHVGPRAPYLTFTPEEVAKHLKSTSREAKGNPLEDRHIEILDIWGQPLKYHFPGVLSRVDLHSTGKDKDDAGGKADDISYLPPHFDDDWYAAQQPGWRFLGVLAVLAALRALWVWRRPKREKEETLKGGNEEP